MTTKTRRMVVNPPRSGDRPTSPRPLPDHEFRHAAGGVRKAGKGQQEYLTVTMTDAQISSFSSGS